MFVKKLTHEERVADIRGGDPSEANYPGVDVLGDIE
jgi:hypothetical protein